MNRLFHGIAAVVPAALASTVIVLLSTGSPYLSAQPASELTVAPTRLLFEGTTKSGDIRVQNSSSDTLVYSIEIVNYRMTETGEFVLTSSPATGQLVADRMIQATPKELRIPPKGGATIKVQCNRPTDLADGEYRSHLSLRFLRRASPALDSLALPALDIDYDIAIPIIIRQGSLSATVTISYLNVDLARTGSDSTMLAGDPFAATRFERSGTRSTYGDVSVWYIDADANRILLGELKGIALYTPNNLRRLRIPLTIPPDLVMSKGQLRIEYREGESVVAELEVPVQ